MVSTNILLGAIAGITIFLGLPIARWDRVTERIRGILTMTAAGVLLFLIIEVGYHAMETIEVAAKGSTGRLALHFILIFIVGLSVGLIGLAWLEQGRLRKRSGGAEALEVATMIAIGIGVHNFAEGLAIGQSFAGGAVGLGTTLVIGFALHNATEGFGIVAPLATQDQRATWRFLGVLGVIGGGPTLIGTLVGQSFVNDTLYLAFLALAAGSILYVVLQLFRAAFRLGHSELLAVGLLVGLLAGFATDFVLVAAGG